MCVYVASVSVCFIHFVRWCGHLFYIRHFFFSRSPSTVHFHSCVSFTRMCTKCVCVLCTDPRVAANICIKIEYLVRVEHRVLCCPSNQTGLHATFFKIIKFKFTTQHRNYALLFETNSHTHDATTPPLVLFAHILSSHRHFFTRFVCLSTFVRKRK